MRSLLTLSVFLVLMQDTAQGITVSLRPRYPQVYVGDDVTLICNIGGGSKQTTWFCNGTIQIEHPNSSMLLTTVTSKNNGEYTCEQNGDKSEPYTLTVLELEPHAQLFPSVGGTVMSKGQGTNLMLQVDKPEELKDWACFAFRRETGSKLGITINEKKNRAVFFAEFKDAERATFWCLNKKTQERSNVVTLKMTDKLVMLEPPVAPALQGEPVSLRCVVWGGGKVEEATFYKNQSIIKIVKEETYTISRATQETTGKYSCHATYRYSHTEATAAKKEGNSDTQEITVIDGPPATIISASDDNLKCSCPSCSRNCTSYRWYHTQLDDLYYRRSLSGDGETLDVELEGLYSCRLHCGKGFSRLSHPHRHKAPQSVNTVPILLAAFLMITGVLIVVLVALKRRRQGTSNVQTTKQDKDKTTGGDYEQIQLKDTAVYHTLGESTDKNKDEGGYEALKKTQEEGVYHTVGPGEGKSQAEGQSQAEGEGQGGYQALQSVKAEVYQTLSSDTSKKAEGEAEGGYEQLSQKAKDYEVLTVEENPYEELKSEKQKKELSKEAE